MKKIIDRISFPTEFNNKKELRASIVLLFFTCLAFFVISSIMINFNLYIFSKTLLTGTLAYEFILFYLLDRYIDDFIKKEIKTKVQKPLYITSKFIFGTLIVATFLTLIYTMTLPTPETENKFISLITSLFLIVLPTFFWDELVRWYNKRKKKFFFFLIALFFLSNGFCQENTSLNLTSINLQNITQQITYIEKGVSTVQTIINYMKSLQTFMQTSFNLTPQQSQITTLILILIGAFLLLKFLSVIVKWVIVILIVWIILQLLI